MADPVTAAIAYIGTAVGGAAGATLILYSTQLATAALLAATVAAGNAQRRKAQRGARDAYNASLRDRLVMVATADVARSRVYGRVRNVDGVLFKATRGADERFYTLIVALAGHEVDAIEDVYFNDSLLALDAEGYVQTAPWAQGIKASERASLITDGSGNGSITLPFTPLAGSVHATGYYTDADSVPLVPVVSGALVSVSGALANAAVQIHYQHDALRSYARVRKYLGGAAQDLSAELLADFPALITAADKFRGIALLRLDLEYSQEAFPTGVPQASAVMRGAKVFDPRSSSTAWTQNPALIARDWSRHAQGGNTTAVSDAAVIAAANACDVDTTFTAPSGAVVMDTYQCGIVAPLDASPADVLDDIVESMAGRWGWAGGTLRLVAGAWRAPLATITEDWISDAADIQIVPSPPRSELFNSIRATISNRSNGYVAEPAPPLTPASYVGADGQELAQEIAMGGVTHALHAQHIAGVLLRDARQGMTVQLPCKLNAWALELFDTVSVTLPRFGWSAKSFEVLGWRFSLAGGVMLTLKESAASVYDADAGFADLGDDDNTELPLPWVVATLAGLTASSGTALQDGTVVTRTQLSWTPLADAGVTQGGRIEVQWAQVGPALPAGDWPGQSEAGSAGSTVVVGLRANRVYVFRARAVNGAGVRGNWSLQVAHLVAAPADPSGSFTTAALWEFRASTDGWTALGATLAANADSITLSSSGGDPRLYSPPGIAIAGASYASVRARVRRLAGSTWQGSCYYSTGGHGESESFQKTIAEPDWRGWVVLEWDMHALTAGGTDWALSTITQFRLDLGAGAADHFEIDWVAVGKVAPPLEPAAFRVVARGAFDTQGALAAGLYNGKLGTLLRGAQRSYMMSRLRRSDGAETFHRAYDVWGAGAIGGFTAATLAADLNATGSDSVVVVWSFDEPQASRLASGLDAALYRCGASRAVFGSPQFRQRAAYVLVALGGCGEGNGYEAYSGSVDGDANAWCDVTFSLGSGLFIVTGSAHTPRTLADYSYSGDLAATRDVALVARGSCTVSGNTAAKPTGSADWDSDVYSTDAYAGGVFAAASPAQANAFLMFGLNTDPLTDASYTSIDYAWYAKGDGTLEIWESSALIGGFGGYSAGVQLALTYDGERVRYLRNGEVLRTVPAVAGRLFYFDSSFHTVGAKLAAIRFGPLSNAYFARSGNLVDASWWRLGVNPLSRWAGNQANGASDDFISATLPDGSNQVAWRAVAGAAGAADAGGGWNPGTDPSNRFPVDPAKTYLFACYINKANVTTSGLQYWGIEANTVCALNTATPNANPYFAIHGSLQLGRWYLFIGWVHPAGSGGMVHGHAGIWDCASGQKIAAGESWCWAAGVQSASTRAYQFYSDGGHTYFARPQVYLCDGSEPSMKDLLPAVGTEQIGLHAVSDSASIDYGEGGTGSLSTQSTSALNELVLANPIEIAIDGLGSDVRIDCQVAFRVDSGLSAIGTDHYVELLGRLEDAAVAGVTLAEERQEMPLVTIKPVLEAPNFRRGRLPIGLMHMVAPYIGTRTYRLRLFWSLVKTSDGVRPATIGVSGLGFTTVYANGSISYRRLKR